MCVVGAPRLAATFDERPLFPSTACHAEISAYSRNESDGSTVVDYAIVCQVYGGDPVVVAEGEGSTFSIPHLLAVDELIDLGPFPLRQANVTVHFEADADCEISDSNCISNVRTNEATLGLTRAFVSTSGYQ